MSRKSSSIKFLVFSYVFIVFFLSISFYSRIGISGVNELGSISPKLDSEIQRMMEEGGIPSIQAGIVIQDELIWAKDYGSPSGLESVYMVASISKTITATVFLQLYERNLIDLNEDINSYIPFEVRHPSYPTTEITFRMLLAHESGLNRYFYYSDNYAYDNDVLEWGNEALGTNYTIWSYHPTLEEFLHGSFTPSGPYYSPDIWEWRPGLRFLYSSAGYLLLEYLVECITNQTFAMYVQENIWDPLGMTSSGYNANDFVDVTATPFERIGGISIELPIYNYNNLAAGGLRTTVSDLAKFMIAHMNQGESNGYQLLKAESVESMHQTQNIFGGKEVGNLYWAGYGLGWSLYTQGIQGHSGSLPGYGCHMLYNESDAGSYGIITITNLNSAWEQEWNWLDDYYGTIRDMIFDEAASIFDEPASLFNPFPLALLLIGVISIAAVVIIIVRYKFFRKSRTKSD